MIHYLINTIQMMIFERLRTGNSTLDAIVSTIVIYSFSYLIQNVSNCDIERISKGIQSYAYNKPYQIEFNGKSCELLHWNSFSIHSLNSDTVNAIKQYIILNIDKSSDIYKIKEQPTSNNDQPSFIVDQTNTFNIDKDIFVTMRETREKTNDSPTIIITTTITIYSYKFKLSYLKSYIDNILLSYNKLLQTSRAGKNFVYTVDKMIGEKSEIQQNMWTEEEFVSNRTFDNLFVDGKSSLLSKIDFFLKNKQWYDDKGIPYNLGIGLHGSPGTGKTSFIKALANRTNRDIVVVPLKLIKTTSELKQIFFETTYNEKNLTNSKTFDTKILVFEDIDCLGSIVKNRQINDAKDAKDFKEYNDFKDYTSIMTDTQDDVKSDTTDSRLKGCRLKMTSPSDNVTLDDFLNLWDGVRETPGLIIIITSNHYNQLDPALIRPGRIDITKEFTNVSHTVLQEMHLHLFNTSMDSAVIEQINTYFYSPAEIVNVFLSCNGNEVEYINRLKQNQKV